MLKVSNDIKFKFDFTEKFIDYINLTNDVER